MREIARSQFVTHGAKVDGKIAAEYLIWQAMKERCHNERNKAYPDYGARGIVVCAQWRDSYQQFIADMGPRTSPKHSIDRRDNNCNYEPSNCYWATSTEQNRNSRHNRLIALEDEQVPLSVFCERFGLKYDVIHSRLQNGWTVERALTQAPRRSPRT